MRTFVPVLCVLFALGCDDKKSESKDKDKKEESSDGKKTDKDKGDKDKGDKEKEDKGKKAKDDDEAKKEPKKDEAKKADEVEGLGAIPPWSADGVGKPCTPTATAKKRFAELAKGTDADLEVGKADVEAMKKELAGDCHKAAIDLSVALNSGGFEQYKKKKYKEADRFWRAALVVRPSLVLARYNLACGLALDGHGKAAIGQLEEMGRAAKDGDPTASNLLEKAKADDDLKSVRDEAAFKDAVKAAQGGLVGPRKEPETAAAAVKLLPPEFLKGKDPIGGARTYKPALLDFWTWRPDADTELLVATVVDDPSTLGKPKGDMNTDYGGIVVLRRKDGALSLLLARKTGEIPPSVAGGAGGKTVRYSFDLMCGTLRGTLSFAAGKVVVKESTCSDAVAGEVPTAK
ncbi:MAG: hypothetical protein IPJ34_11665 [Myxococcales bacterium]|nr:hypothetical protein [Myxococcales bacterium]